MTHTIDIITNFRLNAERQYGYSSEFESRTTDFKVTSIV